MAYSLFSTVDLYRTDGSGRWMAARLGESFEQFVKRQEEIDKDIIRFSRMDLGTPEARVLGTGISIRQEQLRLDLEGFQKIYESQRRHLKGGNQSSSFPPRTLDVGPGVERRASSR